MALYAIADLHLPLGVDKPMDIFGSEWDHYVDRLQENWQNTVRPDDTVVLPGDFSWATYLSESQADFEFLNRLNGIKILLKGNHDYWWTTKNKLDTFIEEKGYHNIHFLQNNSYLYKGKAICGTRGWIFPGWDGFSADDAKIYAREVQRLELSLKDAQKNNPDEEIVFTHYPPISKTCMENEFTRMMKKYGVKKCIYGHLHAASHKNAVQGNIGGIEYILVSGDYRQFQPLCLIEN